MPSTGNRLRKSNASSKLGVGRKRAGNNSAQGKNSHLRTADTVQRLKMYSNGKAIRNKEGKVVAGAFMMKDRAGDRKIDASTGRIQPDRRWFGNTRVVDSTELDQFRDAMTEKVADPYSVVLKRKKLPMGLLQDAAEYDKARQSGGKSSALLEQEPFGHTFGKQSRRKRVKLDQYLITRQQIHEEKKAALTASADDEGKAHAVTSIGQKQGDSDKDENDEQAGYAALLATAQSSQTTYQEINTSEGIVPWGRDKDLVRTEGEGIDWRVEKKDDLFLKGQSKRIWGEFFKVLDCSDVVLHVIDARNVPGTRCTMIERHIAKNAKHKHLVFVLNKIDLVPNWVAKRWMGELAKARPTIAFHSSLTHAFGKGALISLLRQFGTLHEDKKQISVGVVGYPNVGKSSVINTLISKKSCKVAPVPGETKIWQYITLFKRIALIDCPGVVVDTAGDSEEDSVLKGVVRAERLESPADFVDAILERVKREHVAAQYKLPKDGEGTWSDSLELLEMIARRSGRLLKGGDPCTRSAAIMLINDFQRGRLPHYVAPPELKDKVDQDTAGVAGSDAMEPSVDAVVMKKVRQDLDAIGQEHMAGKDDTGKTETPAEEDERADRGAHKSGAEHDTEEHTEDDGGEEERERTSKRAQSPRSEANEKTQSSEMLIADGEWDD